MCTQSHALAISYDVVMAIVYMPNANTHYLWTTSCCRDVHTIRKYLLRGLCLSLALNCSCCATQLTSSIVLTFSSPCLYLVSKGKGKGKVSLPRKRGPFAGTEMDKRKLWGRRVSKKTKKWSLWYFEQWLIKYMNLRANCFFPFVSLRSSVIDVVASFLGPCFSVDMCGVCCGLGQLLISSLLCGCVFVSVNDIHAG